MQQQQQQQLRHRSNVSGMEEATMPTRKKIPRRKLERVDVSMNYKDIFVASLPLILFSIIGGYFCFAILLAEEFDYSTWENVGKRDPKVNLFPQSRVIEEIGKRLRGRKE